MGVRHAVPAAAAILAAFFGAIAAAQDNEDGPTVDPELERSTTPDLDLPAYDATRGRALFVTKGCVVCHAVNDVGGTAIRDLGGEPASPLDARLMPITKDPFEFFARFWRGAPTMIALQQERLGYQIALDGSEFADIMAFVYSEAEQAKFTADSFTPPIFWYRDEAANSQGRSPDSGDR